MRTNPACPNLQSLGPKCDSGAQFALQDPEMTSVKLEDCSPTMELNVNIKDEEDKIEKSLSQGKRIPILCNAVIKAKGGYLKNLSYNVF